MTLRQVSKVYLTADENAVILRGRSTSTAIYSTGNGSRDANQTEIASEFGTVEEVEAERKARALKQMCADVYQPIDDYEKINLIRHLTSRVSRFDAEAEPFSFLLRKSVGNDAVYIEFKSTKADLHNRVTLIWEHLRVLNLV